MEQMEVLDDDDMFVVIIGDDDDDSEQNSAMRDQVKLENENYDEIVVENLIETAEKHGHPIEFKNVKQEPLDAEYCEDEFDAEYIAELSDEYSEEEYLHFNKRSKSQRKHTHRYKLLNRSEQKSFVNDLRQQHPELAEDQELLIDTLSRIMVDFKRPKPPRDFFIMDGIMFECVQCGHKTESIPAAERHYREKHGPRYLICFACGVDFRSTTNLYKHEKRCGAIDAIIVLKARARTLGRKGRGRPFLVTTESIRKIKNEKKFPCEQCGALFPSRQAVSAHENSHSGARPHRCALCPATYTSGSALSKHHKVKHTDVQFTCDTCSRSFKTKSALVVHMDTHNAVRKFVCAECGRRYAQKLALQLHGDRVHRRLPPPCACQICPKRYPRMYLLKTHMLKEHGLNLITKKMFHKTLPLLSESQLKGAKVVFKADVSRKVQSNIIPKQEPLELPDENENNTNLSEELLKFIQKLHDGQPDTTARYIVIQNGEAISIDRSKLDFYKNNLIAEVEYELEQQLEIENDEPYEDDEKKTSGHSGLLRKEKV